MIISLFVEFIYWSCATGFCVVSLLSTLVGDTIWKSCLLNVYSLLLTRLPSWSFFITVNRSLPTNGFSKVGGRNPDIQSAFVFLFIYFFRNKFVCAQCEEKSEKKLCLTSNFASHSGLIFIFFFVTQSEGLCQVFQFSVMQCHLFHVLSLINFSTGVKFDSRKFLTLAVL